MDIITIWQHIPQYINPIFLSIGELQIRYYGLMYLAAFTVIYFTIQYIIKTNSHYNFKKEFILDLSTWIIIGLLIGARFGYALFYNFSYFFSHPLEIILPMQFTEQGAVFTGIAGMSYHGGVIGILFAAIIFIKKRKKNFWKLADLYCLAIPLGYTFGRIGNFLNGELWGRQTDSAIGMYFPNASGAFLRHPSQIYEAFFEGIVLFTILWLIKDRVLKKYQDGSILSFYLFGYAFFRFVIEYFREPDAHIGLLYFSLTMGQLLNIGMIIVASWIFFIRNKKNINHKN